MGRPSARIEYVLVLAAVVALAALAGCATAPKAPARVAPGDLDAVTRHLEELIAHEMRAAKLAGLGIAIVDGQQVVWARGFGSADREGGLAATPATVYRMGSISKLFTAAAALQLAQKGRLALDAPIQQALPGFAIRSRYPKVAITPRLLMTHHAGLPRDVLRGMWAREPGDFRAMVAGLAQEDLAYPPAMMVAYSNLGPTVLGAAIEQVAAQPFADYVRQHLFEPLGMQDASFATGAPAATRAYDADGKRVYEPALRDVPAGGLNASVLDLARFMMMVFGHGRAEGHTVLEPAMIAEMLRPQNAGVALDRDMRIGLGWMLTSFGADTLRGAGAVAHHGGATIHYRSQMYVLPEHNLGVIVASNSGGGGRAVDRIAKRALALALDAKRGIREQAAPADFTPAARPPNDDELQAWVGDYATVAGHVRVVRNGKRLLARVEGRELQLVPGENGSLGLRYALFGLIPISLGELEGIAIERQNIDGREAIVARVGGQALLVGSRIVSPGGARMRHLVGEYEAVVTPSEPVFFDPVQVSLNGDLLLARTRLRIGDEPSLTLPLKPLSDDALQVLGTLADAGEVIRLSRVDGETRLRYAGYEFRRTAR